MNSPSDQGIGSWLCGIWERVERLPTWAFVAWVSLLLLLRSGVRGVGYDELLDFARTFPHPGPSYRSNAVLGPALASTFGLDNEPGWNIMHLVLVAGCFTLAAVLLRRRLGSQHHWRVGLVWLSFLSIPTSLLRFIGWYDVFTVTGAVMIALGGNVGWALAGGAVIGATNPEQGLLVIGCGALLTFVSSHLPDPTDPSLRDRMVLFPAALIGLVATRAAVLVWFGVLDADVQSRSDLFGELLRRSVSNATSLGSAGVYAWLAVGWVLVVWLVWTVRIHRRSMLAAISGLVVIPGIVTVVTLDGSRVFASVSSIAILLTVVAFAEESQRSNGAWIKAASAALLLFGILVPALTSLPDGTLPAPWGYLVLDVLGL